MRVFLTGLIAVLLTLSATGFAAGLAPTTSHSNAELYRAMKEELIHSFNEEQFKRIVEANLKAGDITDSQAKELLNLKARMAYSNSNVSENATVHASEQAGIGIAPSATSHRSSEYAQSSNSQSRYQEAPSTELKPSLNTTTSEWEKIILRDGDSGQWAAYPRSITGAEHQFLTKIEQKSSHIASAPPEQRQQRID